MTIIDAVFERVRRLIDQGAEHDGHASASRSQSQSQSQSTEPDTAASGPGQARRDRGLGLPQEILHRALAQKVLDGWLRNRNQVLVPLTLRLGQLRADDVELLMRFAAASLLAAAQPSDDARLSLSRWLRSIGAIDDAIVVFERSLGAPTALSTLLDRVQARHLEAYAYAIAVLAADLRVVHGRLYADFIAAKLALPADSVRSINRRYHR